MDYVICEYKSRKVLAGYSSFLEMWTVIERVCTSTYYNSYSIYTREGKKFVHLFSIEPGGEINVSD